MEKKSIYARLAEAQVEFVNIRQDQIADLGNGKRFKYADINSVLEAIRPILNCHGLVLVQSVFTPSDAHRVVSVETSIYTFEGESIKSGVFTASTEGLLQKGVQALGSLITYMKRYQLMALLGIAYGENDDDGAAAVQSEAQADKNAALISDADYYARQGRDSFIGFWKGLTKAEKAILTPHLDRLKEQSQGKPSAPEGF